MLHELQRCTCPVMRMLSTSHRAQRFLSHIVALHNGHLDVGVRRGQCAELQAVAVRMGPARAVCHLLRPRSCLHRLSLVFLLKTRKGLFGLLVGTSLWDGSLLGAHLSQHVACFT